LRDDPCAATARAIRSRRPHRARRGAGVDRSTRHRTTALARAARARYGTVHFYILNFSTFSAACMEWRDGRAARSKNARMVMEPCLLMFPPPWWLLLASLGIFYWRSFCSHHVSILSSFSARQTPRSAPNMTKKTRMDAASQATSVGTNTDPRGGWVEP